MFFPSEAITRDGSFFRIIRMIQPISLKVAQYSFAGSIPAKFEHKLRRQKQSFGKIATTVVLNKAENFF